MSRLLDMPKGELSFLPYHCMTGSELCILFIFTYLASVVSLSRYALSRSHRFVPYLASDLFNSPKDCSAHTEEGDL